MNNVFKKLLEGIKKQKFFVITILSLIVAGFIYLFILEGKIIDLPSENNVQVKIDIPSENGTSETIIDKSINKSDNNSYEDELNKIQGSNSQEKYHKWLDGEVVKVYNKKFYLDIDYKSKYSFIDDNDNISYGDDKCNVLKKQNKNWVYVDYRGKMHDIIELNNDNIKSLNVGDYIYYGNYDNLIYDDDESDATKNRKLVFRVVDINDGIALIHSVFAINNRYGSIDEDGYVNSTLRTYLNDEFYNFAFTEEEKKRIVHSEYKYEKDSDSKYYEKYNDYISILSNDDAKNFYAIGYSGKIILKPRDIKDAYSNENLNLVKQVWIADSEGSLYKPQYGYTLKAYDRDREGDSFVLPILKINIGYKDDESKERLPDLEMLKCIQKTFMLNGKLYFIDYDKKLGIISNYTGERIVDRHNVKIIKDEVGYLYKQENNIYFTSIAEYASSGVALFKLKDSDEIEKIADNVFPYIKFKRGDNFIFIKNARDETETIGNFCADVIKGEMYEYSNNKIMLDEASQKEKESKNKRLTTKKGIETRESNKGKVYDRLNLVFYDKGEYRYVNVDGVEHKFTHYTNDKDYSSFNLDRKVFVKNNNVYIVEMSDVDAEKKYLYALYKDNGQFLSTKIDESDLYIRFLYVNANKFFYAKGKEIKDSYEYAWTICSYEFGGSSEELYRVEGVSVYYCSLIDKAFCVKRISNGYVYHYSLEMVDEEGIKLIDEYINEHNIIATPEGIYYTTRGENNGLYFYDGNKNLLIDKGKINKATHSDDYRFVYFETLEEKTANLNDYLILPDKDDKYYKEKIADKDPKEYVYYNTSVYVACKDKIKKLADNAEIKSYNDKIIMTTYKSRKEEKKELKKALESVKYKNNSIFTFGSESISNYLLYLERDSLFNYIFDGDRGSRFNKGDSYVGSSLPWLIKDDILACNGGGIYAGKINYEEVSNLYKLVNKVDENELRVLHINIKNGKVYIYYELSHKNSFSNGKRRVDLYCYYDNKNELILENLEGFRITEDSENNVYVIQSSDFDSSYRKETLYKIVLKDDKLEKEVFGESVSNLRSYNICSRTYDDVRDKGFYYENDEDNKSLVGISFSEDNPESTVLKDIDKSNLVTKNAKFNNEALQYRELNKGYVEGSKDYYQKTNVKVDRFYNSMGELYVYIGSELKFVDDNFGYGSDNIIVYDALNDEYYYNKVVKNNIGMPEEMQNILLKIKNNQVNKKVVASVKVKDEDYNYQIKYLGRLGENYIWADSAGRVLAGKGDGKVNEIGNCGNGSFSSNYLDDEFKRGQSCRFISLNTYENKLYYTGKKTLYVIDEKLQSKKISDNVKEFVALQNEVLYIAGGLFRYSDGKSVKLFDVDEMSIHGRHNDKKCYVYTKKSKYIKDVFYIDDNADNNKKASWESCKNYWLGFFGTIYLYENGELKKLLENVEYPINRVINDYWQYGGSSLADPYLLTKSIVGNGEKINFDEFYKYCKDIDMTDTNENYKCVRAYKRDKIMNAYIINGHDIREVEVLDDFKIYDTSYFRIKSIKSKIIRVKYEYEDLEFDIDLDDVVKSKYDIKVEEYNGLKVLLTENYLYNMFE